MILSSKEIDNPHIVHNRSPEGVRHSTYDATVGQRINSLRYLVRASSAGNGLGSVSRIVLLAAKRHGVGDLKDYSDT